MLFCSYYFGSIETYKNKLTDKLDYSKNIHNDIIEYFIHYKKEFFKIINQFDITLNYETDSKNNTYSKVLSLLVFVGDIDDVELKKKFDTEVAMNQYVKYLFINYDFEKLKYIQDIYDKFSYKNYCYQDGVDVCVFDLDLTIITHDGDLYYNSILKDISLYHKYFDYVILWSNGDTGYVYEYLERYPKMKTIFDFIITRKPDEEVQYNKGVSYVLNYLFENKNITKINFACLVDDLPSNFSGDYDLFLLTSIDEDDDKKHYYAKFLEKIVQIKDMYNQKSIIPDKFRVLSSK